MSSDRLNNQGDPKIKIGLYFERQSDSKHKCTLEIENSVSTGQGCCILNIIEYSCMIKPIALST